MTEITPKLSTALADRYKIERHLGEGDRVPGRRPVQPPARPQVNSHAAGCKRGGTMFHKNATMAFGVIALLTVSSVQAQRVPVADGAIADEEWPTVDEIGVPLYPDLVAVFGGTPPTLTGDKDAFRFVNFASQADVPTLLAWYGEHAEGWVVDADMQMLFPEGVDANAAMMGGSPFVNIMDMTDTGMCMNVPCTSMVQVVYEPEQ